ncbi:MAG TPA: proton-conducting transporter membrane subunit [Myxococcota bacterium]|nr:proton-conducting transporter membrane subunit [Myxococcota bacterium]
MSPLGLALAGAGILAASAALSLVLARAGRIATGVALAGALAGCGAGLWAALAVLRSGLVLETATSWQVPGGALVLGVDPLSAFFLVPLFVLGGLAAVYGRQSLGGHARPTLQIGAAAALNLLIAAMAGVLLARHALLFLVAWETMTLLAYWLVTLDHQEAEVRRAGWAYLVASHVGVVALLALFLTLGRYAGGALDFASLEAASVSSRTASAALFALALVGFGIKAGVAGLHVWLPEAHGAAPSHVSALMSGALIKLGVYGLVRVVSMLPPSSAYGAVLMGLGLAGALLGITLAIDQRDLKRALAYSSIENVGIVLLGLGLGL